MDAAKVWQVTPILIKTFSQFEGGVKVGIKGQANFNGRVNCLPRDFRNDLANLLVGVDTSVERLNEGLVSGDHLGNFRLVAFMLVVIH